MENQIIIQKTVLSKILLILFLIWLFLLTILKAQSAYVVKEIPRESYLSDLNHINITSDSTKNLRQLKELIAIKKPKAICIEQWILEESGNKSLIKKLQSIAKKNKVRFYLIIGRNSWFGKRGVANTLEFLNRYEKHIDGIILRIEPNKVNVWKDDLSIHAQVLNQMLDAYSAIHYETKKRNKSFFVEFPFWLSDYQGPKKSFAEMACDYSDKVIFLIDNLEKLNDLTIKWNDVTCIYNIDITKRATMQTEEQIHETLKKLNSKLTYYANFNGYIVDSDSTLSEANRTTP